MPKNSDKIEEKSTEASPKLTWTLAICTYNRPHFLLRTIEFALLQSRSPAEIVVVDASDDWDVNRDRVTMEFTSTWSEVRLVYVPAKVRSLTFQRNQAMLLATSDIVFSLDDDIYMFGNAAENILQIYEADDDHIVSMVAGHFASSAPGTECALEQTVEPASSIAGRLRIWLENKLTLDGHFVTYEEEVDRSPLPPDVRAAGASVGGLINGGRTTARRKWAQETGWSELLRYYSSHEDSDFSYRMSLKGRLVHANNARFFHADGNEGTRSRYLVNLIRVRNLMALHVLYSQNRWRSAFRLSKSFLKFVFLYMLIDPAQKRFSFPTVRAYLFGLVQIPVFLFWPFNDFSAWYTHLQEKMYGVK